MDAIEIIPGAAFAITLVYEAPHPSIEGAFVPVDITGWTAEAKFVFAGSQLPVSAAVTDAAAGEISVLAMPDQTAGAGEGNGVRLWAGVTPPNGQRVWLLAGHRLKVPAQ